MGKIIDRLKTGEILLSDGAIGTQLFLRGIKPGECPELWNIERASEVSAIAAEYVLAGSDMLTTNSFGGTSFRLKHFALEGRAQELNKAAASLVRSVAGDKIVLGSIGSTGKMLLMGDITADEMYAAFAEQAQALKAGGADAIIIETMMDAEEAAIAVRASKQSTDLEVICTFTFDKTKQGDYRTMMGIDPATAMEAVLEAGADIVGTNCGNGIEGIVEIVEKMRQARPHAYIMAQANAGLPENRDGVDFFPDTADMMAEKLTSLIAAGANIVGGCCGTTPEHIAAMRKVIDKQNASK